MDEVFNALEPPGTISQSTTLAMRVAVGFRNVAVHDYDYDYDVLSWAIVHPISQRHLQDFKRFAGDISTHLPGDTKH